MADTPPSPQQPTPSHTPLMSGLDMVSLVVGIVIGVSIFKSPAIIFGNTGSATGGMAIWLAGAGIAFSGALCYSELACAYPHFGAEFVYLSRAYGRRFGLLFAWMQVFAIITGNIGAMAFVFSQYGSRIFNLPLQGSQSAALAGVAVISSWIVHAAGVRSSRRAQNVLSVCKILSLVLLIVCGLCVAPGNEEVATARIAETAPATLSQWGLALVFVLFAYGGWNDATTVAPDVVDCRRNVPRALLLALSLITVLYLAVNASYLRVLEYQGIVNSTVPAADLMSRVLGERASQLLSVMIMISALGAIHGLLLAGCRMLQGVSDEFPLFETLGRRASNGAAQGGLAALGLISLLLIGMVGTSWGLRMLQQSATALRLMSPDAKPVTDGFDLLITAASPVFNFFFLLTALAVLVLRWKDPQRARPFRVPLYPLPVVIFASATGWMLWSSAWHAGGTMLLLLPVGLAGLLVVPFVALRGEETRKREATGA